MKQFFSVFAAILLTAAAPAKGCSQETVTQENVTEQRSLGSFHAVKVSNGIELVLKEGNEESVTISAEEDDIARVKTEVVDGELRIYMKKENGDGKVTGRRKVRADVLYKKIDRITGLSGTRTIIEGTLSGDELSILLGSGSSLDGQLDVTTLGIEQGEGSESTLKGQAQNLTVSATSGSRFEGYELSAGNITATASSGSEIEVQVNKTLTASASSGAAITYKGSGSLGSTSSNSGGRVRKAG